MADVILLAALLPAARKSNRFIIWVSSAIAICGEALQGMVAITLVLIFTPFLAEPFHMTPPPPVFWLVFLLFPPIVFGIDWLRKLVRRWFERSRRQP